MNFTREPIIETIITSKDGFKLVVRNTKGKNEEYSVDALEVVSFGQAIFFRSLEKPKSFLLPVTDFEVIEVRESKVMLKNASIDKTIKIAGGKDSSKSEPKSEEKKEKKKRGRKKKTDKESAKPATKKAAEPAPKSEEEGDLSHVKSLIPPPSTLISETISRYKADGDEDIVLPETIEESLKSATTEEPKENLDAIWMDEENSNVPQDNELSDESSAEGLKLAKAPQKDEPIGKTHAEEALPEEALQEVSDQSDDQ